MISDTPNQFKKIIQQVSPDQGATISVPEKILNNTIKIGNLANKIISYLENIINNQRILNNKLDSLLNNTTSKNNIVFVDRMSARQLYMCYKRGYTLDQISLVSGYDIDTIQQRIAIYMRDNT